MAQKDTVQAIEGILAAGIPYFSLINTLYGVIEGLIARGTQTGELTPAQRSALQARHDAFELEHSTPAQPPPGV